MELNEWFRICFRLSLLLWTGMNCAPVGHPERLCQEPFQVLINEVNYGGEDPFVELTFGNDITQARENDNLLGSLGLIAIEFDKKARKTKRNGADQTGADTEATRNPFKIKAAFDLTDLRWKAGSPYFLVGPENGDLSIQNDLPVGKKITNHMKIYKTSSSDWLTPAPGNFLFLVLTHSYTKSLFHLEDWNLSARKRVPVLEKSIRDYVLQNKHDAIVFAGSSPSVGKGSIGPTKHCRSEAFQNFHSKLFPNIQTAQYLLPTHPSAVQLSHNRCGLELAQKLPFQLASFKAGVPSPGQGI